MIPLVLQKKALQIAAWVIYMAVSWAIGGKSEGGVTHHLDASGWRSVPALLEGVTVQAYGDVLGVPTAAAQWEWSPAAPWHACMVRVQCGSAAGSGVYVHVGNVRFILTAQHVIADGGQTTCRWIDGTVSQAIDQTADKFGHDVAAIRLRDYHDDVMPLPVAHRVPEPGETMEVCGYGGGGTVLRNYYVEVVQAPPYDDGSGAATPGPIHGDSGGGVLTADEEGVLCVATVVSTGAGGSVDGLGDNHAYERLHYPSPAAVSDFASRAAAKWGGSPAQYDDTQCGPGGCPLPGRRQSPPQNDGWFPRDEPYRLGPRRRGGDIDIEINGREREPAEPEQNNHGVLLVAAAAVASVLYNFRKRL